MTVAALGMGWVSGGFLNGTVSHDRQRCRGHARRRRSRRRGRRPRRAEGEHGDEAAGERHRSSRLPPITTNLAAPSDIWVRMEVSDRARRAAGRPELADTIQQDLLAFVRTVKMHQIEGASGFRHLKEDLEERAAIRSDGHVKQVLIRTLLFE